MRTRALVLGLAIAASLGMPASGRAAVNTQHCIVNNPARTSCTVVFSPSVRDITWTVVAPGGTWRLCFSETTGSTDCIASWQIPRSGVTFQDSAALNFRFAGATLQVIGPVVDGHRVGFGILGTEPVRPLCVPTLRHTTFCV